MKVLNILLCLSLMAGHLCIVTSRCSDQKWRDYGKSNSQVALVKEPKSWLVARRYCEGLGGHLANLKVGWLVNSLKEMPGYNQSQDYWFWTIKRAGNKSYSNGNKSATMLKRNSTRCKSVKVTSGKHHLVDTHCLRKRPFICRGKKGPCYKRPAVSFNHGEAVEDATIDLTKYAGSKVTVECVELGSTSNLAFLELSCDTGFKWDMPYFSPTAIITVNYRTNGKYCRCILHNKNSMQTAYVKFKFKHDSPSWLLALRDLLGLMKMEEEKSYELDKLLVLMGSVAGAFILVNAVAVILAIRRKRDAGRRAQDGGVPSVPTADA